MLKNGKKNEKRLNKQHTIDLANRNAVKALSGVDLIREDPTYPPKPYQRVFIPATKLREMVKEAMKNKNEWSLISKGLIQFSDLPILKSMKI